jgi:putative transposase
MRDWQSQSHVKWYCKYHVVFVPKCRRRALYGPLRRQIGGILRQLCAQAGVDLIEGHAMPDHIRLCLSIPPKFSVANTVGFLKGKSAIRIHRECLGQPRNFAGLHFWAKGYCVSTVGLDEQTVLQYIRDQEAEEKRLEQLQLKGLQALS